VDGSNHLRCVEICTKDSDCRPGRSCVTYDKAPPFTLDQQNQHKSLQFCVEGAPLTHELIHTCHLDQLTSYKVGVGESFLVQGTAPTPFVPPVVDPKTFSCLPNPQRMDRIPYFQTVNGVRTPIPDCTNEAAKDPLKTELSPADLNSALLAIMHETPTPNPCLIRSSTQPPTPPATRLNPDPQPPPRVIGPPFRVAFQNREIRFMLTGFEQFPGNADVITFDVHGGFQPDQVVIPTTIDINTPIRIVVGPIDSQGQSADLGPTREFPYMFVIDQRRLGSISAGVGATRGQVLRINPRRATTSDTNSLVPIYDDPVSTNNLWPIQ